MATEPAQSSLRSRGDGGAAWFGRQALVLTLLLFVLIGFNALFTFTNVPATLWVRLAPTLSVEFGILLLAIGLCRAAGLRMGGGVRLALAIFVFLAALLRYADVTAPAIFGRELNFYWDLRHAPDLVVMYWQSAGVFNVLAFSLAMALILAALIAFIVFGLKLIENATARPWYRAGLIAIGAAMIALFGLDRAGYSMDTKLSFARPVSVAAANHLALLAETWRLRHGGIASLEETFGTGISVLSNRGQPDGSDVFVIFIESYGATVIDEQDHFARMKPRYEHMQASLDAAGWHAVSNRIEAPTFGGGSWRSHGTFLSGLRLSDENLYNLLLSTDHESLVSHFNDAGYRTVAVMPGIKRAWPEGTFYGFDRIYDDKALQYPGPDFGFWRIPDQYTLYRTYEAEIAAAMQPLFAMFVLINSHTPFRALPPYVEDWSLFAAGDAYKTGWSSSDDEQRDQNRRYMDAILYEFDIVEDFIIGFLPEDALLIVLGDHQPPGIAEPDAGWGVPIHVFSRDPQRLAPFRNAGFEDGLLPEHPTFQGMENMPGLLLEAASSRRFSAVNRQP
ncbi:sulfatase-like hydrolase/transferase [Chelativorans sp. J32]|uniref:sulfatase-like hydrolase/transferase n=1 Tax=Chelativorans sp. J32 TaxID=935840 RepID=UPI0004859A3B|nr:sulfatase-like hydrolase/transferase [Chelativorans sp. J32]